MKVRKTEISKGALLALAIIYYLDSSGAVVWVLAGCLLHEAGHWMAIKLLGGKVVSFSLTLGGAELRLSATHPLPPRKMLLAVVAGPLANLIAVAASMWLAQRGAGERLYLFAGVNLGLALFNLLPADWLDGGRVLKSLFAWFGRSAAGERLTRIFSGVVAAILLSFGGLLFWQSEGRNFTLLAAGLWMVAVAGREGLQTHF